MSVGGNTASRASDIKCCICTACSTRTMSRSPTMRSVGARMVWICAGVQPLNSRIRCTRLAKKMGNCSGCGEIAVSRSPSVSTRLMARTASPSLCAYQWTSSHSPRCVVSSRRPRGAPVYLHLIAELKRRRVFRALVGYGIAAFAVLQIVEPVMHGLRWPEVTLSYVVVALAIGFPIVVSLAWIFGVNAGRLQRTPASGREFKGTHIALVLTGIGVLAAAPGIVWYFFLRGERVSKAEVARAASIAVLPFANLSGGQENEYFSDGVTEEIINALANIEGVRVVARTSAFSFKGKNVNVRQVGEELNVATVLEGTVRRDGNQLRIAAQLIGAADGYHIWSKTFDRELKNVFSLEDELARAIVQSLKPRLVPDRALVQQAAVSTEAHDLYLKGRYFWNQRSRESLTKAKGSVDQAIALDPRYAVADSG